jgi:hypothetical protein
LSAHPIDGRKIARLAAIAVAIIAFWLVFALFNASEFHLRALAVNSPAQWEDVVFFQLFSSLIWAIWTPVLIAVAERLPVRKPRAMRNLLALLAVIPLLAVARAVFGAVFQLIVVERVPPNWEFTVHSVTVRFGKWCLLIVIITVVTNVVIGLKEGAARERRRAAARSTATRLELARLRACVPPSFVFATLRSIKEKIACDPAEADRILIALCDLLRRTLDFDRRGEVTLGDELDLIGQYLELETSVTTSGVPAMELSVALPDDFDKAEVPPLFLLSFLTNAMRGEDLSPRRELSILGTKNGARLLIEIHSRPGLLWTEEMAEQTRAVLRQVFGDAGFVTTRGDETLTIVTIDMPLRIRIPERAA